MLRFGSSALNSFVLLVFGGGEFLGRSSGKVDHLKIAKRILVLAAGLALMHSGAIAMGTLNPYFTVKDILPPALANVAGIGGIDLFANGDGAICSWGGDRKSQGEVWIIPNLASGTPGTPVRIAQGIREPLGVKVVGQDIYVMARPALLKFTGSGSTWTKTIHFELPTAWYVESQWHYFSWGIVYKDSAFWFSTGMAYDPIDTDFRERGGLIKVAFDGSSYSQYARGMRNTDGIGQGPEGEIFLTDNQGDWKPANLMYHVPTPKTPPAKQGRFYGYRTTKNNDCGLTPDKAAQDNCPQDPVYQPAVWLPYGSYSNSPTRPTLLKAGPYAGQMIFGDVYHGDILRTFVEKVNEEWQGAAFTFMTQKLGGGGIQFGVQQFLYTPSGSLLVTGIGGGAGACGLGGSGNWAWQSTCRGLDLLTPTTATPFDILAIRSIKDGFDIEFTQPVVAAAGQASSWSVKTSHYVPVHAYGQNLTKNEENIVVAVSGATLSEDAKHVQLKMASLTTKRMYAITAGSAVKSASGDNLWTNVGYYTLNSVNTASSVVSGPIASFARRIHASIHTGHVSLDIPLEGAWKLELMRLDGSRISQASGTGPSRFESQPLPVGLYVIAGRGEGGAFSERIQVR
jgi:hypothetical protein